MTYYQNYDNDYEEFLASEDYQNFLIENERRVEDYFSNIIVYDDFIVSEQYQNYLIECENNHKNQE
jgi:hypothetical protein